jgi:hypothetical protein
MRKLKLPTMYIVLPALAVPADLFVRKYCRAEAWRDLVEIHVFVPQLEELS